MTRLVAVDIGGTNARFALAEITADGTINVGEPITLGTSDYVSLQSAWAAFAERVEGEVPRAAAIAIAGPVTGQTVRMTNNSWVLHTGSLDEQLGIDKVTVLNDFGAVAHAVAVAPEEQFVHLAGPDEPLPDKGTITVMGPGTGLGIAHFMRHGDGSYHIQATEGAHTDFAPIDHVDDVMLARLREKHRRVSTERVVSGPGIVEIYEALAQIEHRSIEQLDDRTIWTRGFSGEDQLAVAAIDRFCMTLGSTAGDYALAHGATGVVVAGGLGYRLREYLPESAFAERFRFKGRYESLMSKIPVKLIIQPEPGLFGAAAAFLQEFGDHS